MIVQFFSEFSSREQILATSCCVTVCHELVQVGILDFIMPKAIQFYLGSKVQITSIKVQIASIKVRSSMGPFRSSQCGDSLGPVRSLKLEKTISSHPKLEERVCVD